MPAHALITDDTRAVTGEGKPINLLTPHPVDGLTRLRRGITWTAIGSVVGQGASVLASVALARILGRETYGQFALVQSTVVALTNFANLGLGVTATKYVSQYRTTQPEKAGRILGLSFLFAVLSSSCFSLVLVRFAPVLIRSAALVPELRLAAVYAFFIALNGYQVGALAGLEAFRSIASITMTNGGASLLLAWALTYWLGLRGAVLAMGIGSILLWLHYQSALRREVHSKGIAIRFAGAWQERAALFRCAAPAMLCGVVGSVAIWHCSVILVRESGFADLGVFSAANTLRLLVLFLPGLVTRVTSPLLNNMLATGDWYGYRRIFWGSVAVTGLVALVLAVLCAFAGQRILRLFGRDFVPSLALTLPLLGSVVVEVVANNLYQAIFTARSLWWQAGILTIWSSVLVGCSLALIPGHGASGLAFSYLAAWSVSAILYTTVARVQLAGKRERSFDDFACREIRTSVS